jgi:hypothetical protein
VGGAWLDFGPSSTTALQSISAARTFTSPGTGGQIHLPLKTKCDGLGHCRQWPVRADQQGAHHG